MAMTSCSAFLQTHASRLSVRSGTAMRLLRGTKIGAWRIDGDCRAGTNSATYPVAYLHSDEPAALTVFDTPALALGSYTRRILSTAQILARVDHPGVIDIIDVGLVADGRPYIVTELHEGITLAELVQGETKLELARAITVLRRICAPLIAAHEVGVVHGELDLECIFLVEASDPYIKLLDWGIERLVGDEARRAGIEPALRVRCRAPEEAYGLVSPQTDAHALGVVAYQLLVGRLPFDPDLSLSPDRPIVDPRDLCPAIPSSLAALIIKLLDVDPRQRPTIRAAADCLAVVGRELASPPRATAPELDEYSVSRAPRRATVTAVFAAICAAVAVPVVLARTDEPITSKASTANAAPPRQTVQEQPGLAPEPPKPVEHAMAPSVQSRMPTGSSAPVPVRHVGSAPTTMPPLRATPTRTIEAKRAERVKPDIGRRVDSDKPDSTSSGEAELLTQYQRVGHDLIELRNERGAAAISDMWQQFNSLQIHHALASAHTRAAAAATLTDLRNRIERNKGVRVPETCLQNPLATGCR